MKKYKNYFYFLQGNIRYALLHSRYFSWLVPIHIKEQFEKRVGTIPHKCWEEGSCQSCGCSVPQLQLANKTCGNKCYPKMLNRKDWKEFKKIHVYKEEGKNWFLQKERFV